jgi:tetratricopeptide (TPR) repeat protein
VGGTIARKGIDILIETYIKTFTIQDDVCLVIKDMGGHAFYKGQTAAEMILELQARPDTPEIEYIDQTLNDAELAGLYTACDCLVLPYRGEGFGLPIAEAMASGLPVIVTNYGAALDFCPDEIAYLIPAVEEKFPEKRLGQTETVDYPWWAQPDRNKLKELMEYVVAHPTEAKAKGQVAAAYIQANFTWEHSIQIVQERVEILRQKPIRRLQAKPADPTPVSDSLSDAFWNQVDIARQADDWSTAIILLKEAITLNNNRSAGLYTTDMSSLWNGLGYCYMMNKNLAAAETAFTDGLKIAPDNMDLLNNLAELYLQQENYEEATSYLTHALKVDPNDVNILLSFGNCCVQLDVFDTALTAFRRVQKLAPATPGIEAVIQQLELVPGA